MSNKKVKQAVIDAAFDHAEKLIAEAEFSIRNAPNPESGAIAARKLEIAKQFKILLSPEHEDLIKLVNYGDDSYYN